MNLKITDTLAKRIQYLQDNSELTQTEIANQIGIDRSAYSRILSGNRKISADELSKIADIFGVTTDFLLGRTIDLDDVPSAAHFQNTLNLDDLPKDRRKAVIEYMEYQKSLYKKEMEDKAKKD
ncbi:helix-turn-helix domain-containing protein [Lactiplantibacillus mudanjiangensis]|uniref:XRE family transcriptional regulator [Lactobacillus brevis] n=1 Tax=Lactiplantibacillus mudanjiangensis TaxID=1296538 RepID=A0A660DW82_9LACO|nr:helix-turn-helix transcriptional regulator [Lactiplantibacillus mudanjiangensis]VDG25734.1 XRE family transcriptional regulator [Lactobacillus brevis] [Lactiplantibacillus mudanjiangensis]VDG27909.1 XRE family transcriptional regulator [Lactobacillus brevis] [Lactiplantibacillus mudanjiangensis]